MTCQEDRGSVVTTEQAGVVGGPEVFKDLPPVRSSAEYAALTPQMIFRKRMIIHRRRTRFYITT